MTGLGGASGQAPSIGVQATWAIQRSVRASARLHALPVFPPPIQHLLAHPLLPPLPSVRYRAMMQAAPTYAQWDDHEVVNNCERTWCPDTRIPQRSMIA